MKRKKIERCIYYILNRVKIHLRIWIKLKNVVKYILGFFVIKRKLNVRTYRKRRTFPSMTLVLDLDETLIYCTKKKKYDYQKEIDVLINGKYLSLYVCKRPYIDLFFSVLYPYYEIIIFTTSIKSYADTVLNIMDVDHYIDKKFYREDCFEMNGKVYIKNLVNIKKEISKMILIDDSNASGFKYPDNFFHIKKWKGELNDTELLDSIPFFLNLRKVGDIRSICSFKAKSQKDIANLLTTAPVKHINYLNDNLSQSLYPQSLAFQAINYLKIFMNKFRYARKKRQWNELGKKINNKMKSYPYSLSKLKGSSDDDEQKKTREKMLRRKLHY
ncbi:NLI interacting factor-like phosphatase [Plasmodium berghei]|uniref:NLI interacting factor-like phosphatase n=2 Tax=Plasmodium berghei TaxID=5821 RepID=A0A509ALV0_PLABA|nr:NLI interacting factor-like phosphatase [Plasmodium berghei ANKA]CXI62624.1 NLI interacting factor-like phosphatase [Plasmodium berghei]SCM23731.1 NLI interacting factor-like phosphatase [Plasmodium berghei]SCN26746.1 NLI interacting factor-like phosphatase [Plasmodium berghei]SCO61065.1 NLI interacting factor-like phosphatase [Plasmodium berghei]SCO63165.1 NLI interacting factor-like phosphatase [Plasmodium berghei]|eukprot:XP_034422362.1 NLI interacting factor-like phosphatase [Plasmodium berghei ANKA]